MYRLSYSRFYTTCIVVFYYGHGPPLSEVWVPSPLIWDAKTELMSYRAPIAARKFCGSCRFPQCRPVEGRCGRFRSVGVP